MQLEPSTAAGTGAPLVLIHGIGSHWQMWQPVLGRLAPQRDVIAIDLPGFGASPMPPPGTAAGHRFAHRPGSPSSWTSSGSSAPTWPATRWAAGSRSSWPSATGSRSADRRCRPAGFHNSRGGGLPARLAVDDGAAGRACWRRAPTASLASPGDRAADLRSQIVAHPSRIPPADAAAATRARWPGAPWFDDTLRGAHRRPLQRRRADRRPGDDRLGRAATGCCSRARPRAPRARIPRRPAGHARPAAGTCRPTTTRRRSRGCCSTAAATPPPSSPANRPPIRPRPARRANPQAPDRLAAGVGRPQRQHRRSGDEDRGEQQRPREARGQRVGPRHVGGQLIPGQARRQRREDRQPERAAELLGGVEQRGRKSGLVGRDARVGRGGVADEQRRRGRPRRSASPGAGRRRRSRAPGSATADTRRRRRSGRRPRPSAACRPRGSAATPRRPRSPTAKHSGRYASPVWIAE